MTTAETNATDKPPPLRHRARTSRRRRPSPARTLAKRRPRPRLRKPPREPSGAAKAKSAPAKTAAPKKRTTVGAKASKKAAKPERKASAPRAESKGAKILEMIARAKGATLAEIMKATDWKAHSVRGFISTAAKKHGVKVESAKNEGGERLYRSAK